MKLLIAACLCLIVALAAWPSAGAQATAPAFEHQGLVSEAADTKYPHLGVDGPTVHLAANRNRADASYWSKLDTAPAFGAAISLGPAEEQPDYSTASLAVGPGGTLYYVWVNQPARTIFLRVRQGAAWGPARTVVSGQLFPVHPEVAVAGDGSLLVVWRNPDQPFVYRRSLDGGLSWSSTSALSAQAGVGAAALAAGPGGRLAAAYTGGEGDRLQIYLAQWDGRAFSRRRLTALGGDYADPSLGYTPDGRLFVAWRGVAEAGGGAGVFYAEGQPDGSFPAARLAGGRVAGRVSLSGDAAGNLHLLWTAASADGYQLWYAVRPAAGAWAQPVAAPPAGGTIFNAFGVGAIGTGGAAYAHAASEVFVGTRVSLRHYRFRAGLAGAPAISARPLLAQGAATSRGGALTVSFDAIVGAPAEVRTRWGAPPTDADPWQPFAATLAVAAPTLADPARCAEATLFTQVRAGAALQAQALSDAIMLDAAVQGHAFAYHPGAARGYTDEPLLQVAVEDQGDCSGLATVREWPPAADALALAGSPVAFALPDVEGRYERAVELADRLGNTRVITVGVIYDRTDPSGAYSGPLTVAANPRATALQTISVAGASYSDGDGALPWAVSLAISRAPIDPQAPDLVWTIYPLADGHVAWEPGAGAQAATVSADLLINLANLLPREQLTPGAYYYAAALLDPAGNPTASAAAGQLTLAEVTFPNVYLPALLR